LDIKPKEREALTAQVRAAYKGHQGVVTDYIMHVSEYNARQRLRKCGFYDSMADLSDEDAVIFLEISSLYDKFEADKAKAEAKKKRR
jgi:hypothetical protein